MSTPVRGIKWYSTKAIDERQRVSSVYVARSERTSGLNDPLMKDDVFDGNRSGTTYRKVA